MEIRVIKADRCARPDANEDGLVAKPETMQLASLHDASLHRTRLEDK